MLPDLDRAPASPGCYLFKDEKDRIIYIGKAKNLGKRVRSYFQKTDHDPKTENLVKNIHSFDVIATTTELEALILENTLIKKHQPKYNIDLKDSKHYAYLQITDEAFPRLLLSRKKVGGGRFYGPFVSAQARDQVSNFVKKTFKIRTCRRMPKKPCLRYHIKLCNAPCAGLVSKDDYLDNISRAKKVLAGQTNRLIKTLDEEMEHQSNLQNFESALEIRNQISALESLSVEQNIDRHRKGDEDIINYLKIGDKIYLMLFNVYRGTLTEKQEYVFNYNNDFLEEFLVQYYSDNPVPHEVIIPKEIDESLNEFLKVKREAKVRVTVPKRGEKRKLLELVKKNLGITFLGDHSKIVELQDALGLSEPPHVIECFDISHLSGTSTVGSMVQFRNAKPFKNSYRRFRIKTVEGIGDTAAIAEVVRRRYNRLLKEGSELPNLIIIDGGMGQLNAALKALNEVGVRIPVIAIAKKFENIYLEGEPLPLKLDKKSKALKFIQEIRNEAHRFAIKYHKLLRSKEMVS